MSKIRSILFSLLLAINCYGQGIRMGSDGTDITSIIINAASSVPYAIPYASTVTVDPANGWKQSINATNDMTITFAYGSADTDTLLMVTLWASTNSITFGTNNVYGTNHTAMVWPAPTPTNQPLIISMQNPMFTTNWTAVWHIGSRP